MDAVPGTYACHCTICQRMTGASFAHQMPVAEEVLTVTGELTPVPMATLSGGLSVQRYCAKCLTRIYNTNSARPGVAIVRAGTVDGSEGLSPRLHIHTSTKQPWITLPEGVPAYPEGAPLEVWRTLF
ncbi:GFA family protein [Sphingomonas sp. 7/4-4]|uniref:GFA family protein n=1 Tax=Sphingomonas sp. 7/4-4 TaxID=3018446 RepID=UPI0022F3F01F|nr:GFA family protein [Sphingomonas sp. 7/4-4]WBY08470.1 GFA family protein [Sphingomonas sp. 7/4-4]